MLYFYALVPLHCIIQMHFLFYIQFMQTSELLFDFLEMPEARRLWVIINWRHIRCFKIMYQQ